MELGGGGGGGGAVQERRHWMHFHVIQANAAVANAVITSKIQ